MTKILHIADVHLDRPFAGLAPEAARARRSQLQKTFERCIRMASERGCEVITIGGDLWEDEHVSPDTRASVAHALGGFDGSVIAIAGNHDPLLPGGNYERTDWPDNFHIFGSSQLTTHRLADGVVVWAASWTGEPLTADFLQGGRIPSDQLNILLIHGSAISIPRFAEGSQHCPFDPADVAAAGFDLCLAGHYHRWSHDSKVVYPGSPEPLGWGETGEHCAAIIEIADGQITVEKQPVNSLEFREEAVDCGGASSSAEIQERVEEALAGELGPRLALSVILEGEIEPDCQLNPVSIRERLGDRCDVVRIRDRTTVGYDVEKIAGEKSVRGHFVRRIGQRLSSTETDQERSRLEAARLAGLRALEGKKELLNVD